MGRPLALLKLDETDSSLAAAGENEDASFAVWKAAGVELRCK